MAMSASSMKQAREATGMTRTEVGYRIGRTEQSIISYEMGRQTPSAEILGKLADLYNVTVDTFFDRATS